MQSKTKMATGVAMLSLLLIGAAPAVAASTQSSTQLTNLLQMAKAAQDYVNGLLTIAQNSGVSSADLAPATHLLDLGNKNLTAAQAQSTSPDQAVKDLLTAMKDYRDAARLLQAQLVDVLRDTIQANELTEAWVRHRARAEKLEGMLAQVCTSFPAGSLCKDAQDSLNMAESDLAAAKTALSSTPRDTATAAKDLASAAQLLGQGRSDIAKIADANRAAKALDFVQNVIQKRVNEVQAMANNPNLPQSVKTTVQAQITQAKALLSQAVSEFQSGSFPAGIKDVQSAVQLLHDIVNLVRQNTPHA